MGSQAALRGQASPPPRSDRTDFVSFCSPIKLNYKLKTNQTENFRKLKNGKSQSKFYSIYKKSLLAVLCHSMQWNSRTQHRVICFGLQNSLFQSTVATVARSILAGLEIKLQTIGSRCKYRNHLT